jgi:hypothetical protein
MNGRTMNELCRRIKVITGKEFKQLFPKVVFVRLMNDDHRYSSYKFRLGINEDDRFNPFNIAFKGNLQFYPDYEISSREFEGNVKAIIDIEDIAHICIVTGGEKQFFFANRFIITKFESL